MSEKRFTMKGSTILENGEEMTAWDCCDLLNEQQSTINKQKTIITERDLANERLNKFIIHMGLEKEYIKWAIRKKEYGGSDE